MHEPVLHGPRVDIRPFVQNDVTDRYIAWLCDPVVTRYSNQRFRTHDRESGLSYVRSFADTDNRFLLIRRRVDDLPLGTLTIYASRHHGTADIGIMIGERSIWGQGYGQEAWNLVIEWLLSDPRIRKVTAGALAVNSGMLCLMERSGMRLEATRRQQEVVEGMPVDIVHYARFRDV